MTDPVLIVDRTALEEPCPECTTTHSCGDRPRLHPKAVLREFVVLGDAQLMVRCPTCNGETGTYTDTGEPYGVVWDDCPDCAVDIRYGWCSSSMGRWHARKSCAGPNPVPMVWGEAAARGVQPCRQCGMKATRYATASSGLVPAPVGSTYHDVEIAERVWTHDTASVTTAIFGGEWTKHYSPGRPFARVRTVHVVAKEDVLPRVTLRGPGRSQGIYWLPPAMFDALPDGDPLFVLDGVTAL